jgi:SRSO17 transposase
MSNSPWSAQAAIEQVQNELMHLPGLPSGGMLLLDESAGKKAGDGSAGAGRQYNGRVGSVQMSQVGTFLAYSNGPLWTWIDGELFLPEHWFTKKMAPLRKRLGIPKARKFATKIQLGWQMIQRVRKQGVIFEAVGCDTLYGRSTWLRRQMAGANLLYMAEVPADTQVYLTPPVVGLPKKKKARGRGFTRPRVLSKEKPVEVRDVARRTDTVWSRVCVRTIERGELNDAFAVRRVWTTHAGERPVEEWLVMCRHGDGDITYALSNAPADASLERLAWLKCQRYAIECANQDAKSQAGWDELQAQKYLAWEHHLALTILATWFIAQTKWDWAQQFDRDPKLALQFQTDVLPALSAANVRELLRAAMPLPQLTPEGAADLVVEHLINRTRSRISRLKSQHKSGQPP